MSVDESVLMNLQDNVVALGLATVGVYGDTHFTQCFRTHRKLHVLAFDVSSNSARHRRLKFGDSDQGFRNDQRKSIHGHNCTSRVAMLNSEASSSSTLTDLQVFSLLVIVQRAAFPCGLRCSATRNMTYLGTCGKVLQPDDDVSHLTREARFVNSHLVFAVRGIGSQLFAACSYYCILLPCGSCERSDPAQRRVTRSHQGLAHVVKTNSCATLAIVVRRHTTTLDALNVKQKACP